MNKDFITNMEKVKEFALTHYMTVILESNIQVYDRLNINGITKKLYIKEGVRHYDIELAPNSNYSPLLRFLSLSQEMNTSVEYLFSYFCMAVLFYDKKVYDIAANTYTIPNIEWYVKDKLTNNVIISSDNHLFVGSEYALCNTDMFSFTNDIRSIPAHFHFKRRFNPVIIQETQTMSRLYGNMRDGEDLVSVFLTLSSVELIVDVSKIYTTDTFIEIIPKSHSKEGLQFKSYGYLTDKENKLKISLIGVCETWTT